MDQIYPDSGLVEGLTYLVQTAGWDYHLFTNNLTPGLTNVLGDFTEAAWAGYAVQQVTLAAFSLRGVVSHLGSLQALPVAFLNSSGGTVTAYGFFVTWHVSGNLVCCARFDGAPVSILNGQSQFVTPIVSDYSALAT